MTPTLEFVKTVLQKVSFDRNLFEKELRKGLKMLVPNEVKLLKKWCYEQFGQTLSAVLNKYFRRHSLVAA